jgi:hypothetical protein
MSRESSSFCQVQSKALLQILLDAERGTPRCFAGKNEDYNGPKARPKI